MCEITYCTRAPEFDYINDQVTNYHVILSCDGRERLYIYPHDRYDASIPTIHLVKKYGRCGQHE